MPEVDGPTRAEAPSGEIPGEELKVLSLQETSTNDGDGDDEVVAHASGASYAECTTPAGI